MSRDPEMFLLVRCQGKGFLECHRVSSIILLCSLIISSLEVLQIGRCVQIGGRMYLWVRGKGWVFHLDPSVFVLGTGRLTSTNLISSSLCTGFLLVNLKERFLNFNLKFPRLVRDDRWLNSRIFVTEPIKTGPWSPLRLFCVDLSFSVRLTERSGRKPEYPRYSMRV